VDEKNLRFQNYFSKHIKTVQRGLV